ncbi:MAG: prepilin peptidase [Aestuariivirga sp.]|uniref:prepilin peptidase n=1 Tax=Aestuariivirga sp. TaxID=2650926 RepID=UPI0025C06487|nr:A24 family peptidase [Aestuariivirga sp.]MCA3561125.1 prepilin peptidase [Aestuariivirga sp.]
MVEQPPDDSAPLLNRAERIGAAAFAAAVGLAVTLVAPPPAALATAVLALLMGLITLIDFRHFIIPNALSYPAVPLGIAANVAVFHPGDWTAGLTESLLGAVVGGSIFYLLRALWFRLRGVEGLGLGDVKLAAVAGAWLGPSLLPMACLAASLAGLGGAIVMRLMGRRVGMSDEIPFGSFIAPVILLLWIGRLAPDVPFW